MFKTYKRVIAAVVTVLVLLSNTHPVYAANYAIKNNGLNGIYIDINGSPYVSTEGRMASLKRACTWFVSARVKELTGVYPEINGGQWWWKQSNTSRGYYGFKAVSGSAPSGKAVACYTNHVSVVEAYDGKSYTISEGGNGVVGKASEKYCQITTRTLSQIKSLGGASGSFLGFVSLGVPFPKSDTKAPVIKNASASNITATGYDVSCTATDNVGVDAVYFPTWTVNKGQDDLIWHKGKYEGGKWKYHIKTSDHKGEKGTYITHAYAYDKAGNQTMYIIGEIQVEQYAKNVKLNKTTLQLNKGESATLKATVSPSDAKDKSVTWSSSNKKIVTVSSKGKIKAVGKGTAVITVKLNKYCKGGKNQVKCTVTVVEKEEPQIPAEPQTSVEPQTPAEPQNPTVTAEPDIPATNNVQPVEESTVSQPQEDNASQPEASYDGNQVESTTADTTEAAPAYDSVTESADYSGNNTGNELIEGRYKTPSLVYPQDVSYEGDNIVLTYTNRMVFVPYGSGEYRYCGDGRVYTITVIDSKTYVYVIRDAETNARKMRLYFNYIG